MNNVELRKKASYLFLEDFNCYRISGENCEEVLEYCLSKTVEFAEEKTVNFHFALNSEAEIISEVILYKLEDVFLLFSNNAFIQTIKENEGIQIEELNNLNLLQIEGVSSPSIISKIDTEEDIETLEFKDVIYTKFNEADIYISRFGFTGEFGYQIIIPKSKTEEFINNIFSEIEVVDLEDYIYNLFEVGHPLKKLYDNMNYNLCELGYLWNIDFTKDNFVGKEKLLEQLGCNKKNIVGFETSSEVEVNENVFFDGKKVGNVILVYKNSDFIVSKGLLMLKECFAHSNIQFNLDNNKIVKTVSSPYTIPESWKKDDF